MEVDEGPEGINGETLACLLFWSQGPKSSLRWYGKSVLVDSFEVYLAKGKKWVLNCTIYKVKYN